MVGIQTLKRTNLIPLELFSDLIISGRWILTMICVMQRVMADLCFQPAKTTVPGVSFVTIKNISIQTECFSSVR